MTGKSVFFIVAYNDHWDPGGGGGGTPDFKWQGWSNRNTNQNPKKSLEQNLTPKNPMPNFQAVKISRKHYK